MRAHVNRRYLNKSKNFKEYLDFLKKLLSGVSCVPLKNIKSKIDLKQFLKNYKICRKVASDIKPHA